jgi:hypothetical protein
MQFLNCTLKVQQLLSDSCFCHCRKWHCTSSPKTWVSNWFFLTILKKVYIHSRVLTTIRKVLALVFPITIRKILVLVFLITIRKVQCYGGFFKQVLLITFRRFHMSIIS